MGEIDRRYFDGLMADKKMSLRSLASKMGMGHSQLSLTFSGARNLKIDEAAQLSQIFGEPLARIIEAAGAGVRPDPGRRVSVVGAVGGDGVVSIYPDGHIERTGVPGDLPDNVVALQFRTSGTAMDWTDGWVIFCRRPNGLDTGMMGRWCYCKIKEGPIVVATVKRGYRDGTYNLAGHATRESVSLEWATPVLITRN